MYYQAEAQPAPLVHAEALAEPVPFHGFLPNASEVQLRLEGNTLLLASAATGAPDPRPRKAPPVPDPVRPDPFDLHPRQAPLGQSPSDQTLLIPRYAASGFGRDHRCSLAPGRPGPNPRVPRAAQPPVFNAWQAPCPTPGNPPCVHRPAPPVFPRAAQPPAFPTRP
eukprot:4650958-Prymnesium_polylepis.1